MKKFSQKAIEAVVEIGSFDGILPWEIIASDFQVIRLYSGISDVEIGSIMLSACYPFEDEIEKMSVSDVLNNFVNDEGFVLAGGLLFKEENEVKVLPGCCCGLEDWQEWFDVTNGKCDIWTGHDPNSLIEINDRKIKIWQDRENKNETFSIEFTVDEMVEKLEGVRKDLQDFLFRLGQWTKYLAPELEKEVVKYFAKNMNINL